MRRHWFYILLSVAGGDRHGSGIMRDVLALTDGDLKLWPATLYGSLEELEGQGWIASLERAPADAGDHSARKHWFRITPSGRRALLAEATHLRATARVATRRLAQSGDTP